VSRRGSAGEVYGTEDTGFVRAEAQRILSLDHDGSGFAAIGERDPVVGRLQARFPGLRPVLFLSPYEAAAWALIGHRIRIVQAAGIKARMAAELGDPVDIHGDVRHAFPPPRRLAGLEAFPGLFGRKAEWLRALGEAAGGGALDAAHLRSLAPDRALAELRELPGIGPFSAELILLRGAGEADHLPGAEPRLRRAVARAYGDGAEPTQAEVAQRAERWRPYRTWVAVLLRAALEEDTGEIAGLPGQGT
jgi:DNA-3-methyladenine glycosylase II